MKEIVSVVMPIYNEALIIEDVIKSLLSQELTTIELEILAIDGRSTDDTANIVKKIANEDSRVRYLINEERRTPFAFNIGLKEATGNYIALLGAHAVYAKNYIQTCYDQLIATNSVGCTGKIITKSSNDNFQGTICELILNSKFGVSGKSFRTMKEGYTHSASYPILQKKALLEVGGYDTKLLRNQDNDMNQKLIDRGHKLYITWKTECVYYPPSTINGLLKYALKNGFWNAKSFIIHAKSMKLHHMIPFVFVLGLITTLVSGIVEKVFIGSYYMLSLFLLIFILHFSVGYLFSFMTLIKRKMWQSFLLPFFIFVFHFCYGWGTILGFLKKEF